MKKRIAILGSTGSIGTQALDVIRHNKDKYEVVALSCGSNTELLEKQVKEFKPLAIYSAEESSKNPANCSSLKEIATMPEADIVLNSLMGMRGLEPTLAAIEAGKDIAFANKETLVVGGELVMEAVKRKGVKLLPVDSEHSAIFQALQGNEGNPIKRIILTASGGPFRGYSREKLENVTLAQALKHPNWSMGSKITIDSASMMNKGLEIIEAKWLFDVPLDKIQVVVHPQSVLHSAVEYEDGSVIGQMGNPDMRVPIGYAFSYPERLELTGDTGVESLDLFSLKDGLSFYPADDKVFKTIALARQASEMGSSYPVVLNGANEVLVDLFLHEKIRFIDIQDTLEKILNEHKPVYNLTLEGVLEEDRKIRDYVRKLVEG
ncbi:MAG: 1-deoxy-D-xylulose-5-phosphate reductoisomerase [Bacillota bacterium]|nr:1-deoxy-D-xylulose-5-phosphate reductoisomerase [Bacillota bacterium]